jgi:hypothetical protein
MGGHSIGEPNETGLGPDGTVPTAWNQQAMPPCHLCGAAFAAHPGGMCPQIGTGQPYAYWAAPVGGPAMVPQTSRPRPWNDWLRRYPVLTGALMLLALLAGIGISAGVVHETSHQAPSLNNGNATACAYYWGITNATATDDIGAEAAGWPALQAAWAGITDPKLSAAVQAFDQQLYYADFSDAQTTATAIGSACAALGYGNPG